MASWISYWFDPKRPESAEPLAQTIADIFITGLLAEPVAQPRAAKNKQQSKPVVSVPHAQRRELTRNANRRQAKRRA